MTDTYEDRLDLGELRGWLTDHLPKILAHKFYWPDVYNRINRLIREINSLTKELEQYKNLANGYAERLKDAERERAELEQQRDCGDN